MVELLGTKGQEGGGHQQGPHDKDGVGVLEGECHAVAVAAAVVPVAQHLGDPAVHDARLTKPHQPVPWGEEECI